jgi:hypothetical protein
MHGPLIWQSESVILIKDQVLDACLSFKGLEIYIGDRFRSEMRDKPSSISE